MVEKRLIREVALRVLERHSLSLQADEQHTFEEIDLAKRSRQRREPRERRSEVGDGK